MLEILQELAGLNPEQAGYTLPAQPAPSAAVPAQVQPNGIGGLLSSWGGGQRQPAQGLEGIPQPAEPTWRDRLRTVLSPALMQIGAALMAPPAQRAAILGNLGSVVQAGQKTLADDRAYRAQLAAWTKANTKEARSPSEIELFLANPSLYQQYKVIQKPEKEGKTYRAYTIGTDGQPNLVYEGKEQPTIHNIPREPDKPVHVVIPYGADVSKLQLPPNTVPHFQPPPAKEPVQEVWKQGWETDSTGKQVPILFDTRTGNKKYLSSTGKALPGKQGRFSGQAQGTAGAGQSLIPGMTDVNVGNPNDWTPNPTPAGEANFPTTSSPLQGMSLQQLIELRNKKLRGQ